MHLLTIREGYLVCLGPKPEDNRWPALITLLLRLSQFRAVPVAGLHRAGLKPSGLFGL